MTIATKILDSSTLNDTAEFTPADGNMNYRVKITIAPTANIKVFFIDAKKEGKSIFNGWYLKVKCATWGSGKLQLQAKSDHVDDDWSDTGITEGGDVFTQDGLQDFSYNAGN